MRAIWVGCVLFMLLGGCATKRHEAVNPDDPSLCYDALVYGRIISHEHIGSMDGILPKWVGIWVVDLEVKTVVEGDVATGIMKVQRVSHGVLKSTNRYTWGLRRNDQGGYNMLEGRLGRIIANAWEIGRCPQGAAPVTAYEKLSVD